MQWKRDSMGHSLTFCAISQRLGWYSSELSFIERMNLGITELLNYNREVIRDSQHGCTKGKFCLTNEVAFL